jgi:hypothetical protein
MNFDADDWEEEADKLLQWSASLDFETYVHDWSAIGTSSHAKMGSRFATVVPSVLSGDASESFDTFET